MAVSVTHGREARALLLRDGGVLTTSRVVFGDKAEKVMDVRRGRGGGTPVSASPEESRSSSLRHKNTQQCAVQIRKWTTMCRLLTPGRQAPAV